MVGLSEVLRFSYVWTHSSPQFTYGWTLRSLPVFVGLNFWRFPGIRVVVLLKSPHGFRTVGLLEAPRFLYSWTLNGPPVFAWLDS